MGYNTGRHKESDMTEQTHYATRQWHLSCFLCGPDATHIFLFILSTALFGGFFHYSVLQMRKPRQREVSDVPIITEQCLVD